MPRKIIILAISILLMGFCWVSRQKQILAKINNYEITLEEFKEELKDSPYAESKTYEAKGEFLDNIINRKLILQEAQKRGLDKNEKFLKVIEKFWEQALFKAALEEKTKQAAGAVFVSDKEVEDTYQKMLAAGATDKPYAAAYNQVKWEITRAKQTQLISEWVEGLRQNSDVKINCDLLKK